MTYSELITYVDQAITNNVEESYKLNWLNELDSTIYRDICTEFRTDVISLSDGVAAYDLTGYKFEDIQKVVVDGRGHIKMSAMDYIDGSYFKSDMKLSLYPVPSASSVSATIIRLYNPTEKTAVTQDVQLELCEMFGNEFSNIYEHYLRYKILFHQREYVEANQMAEMFNEASKTFSAWYLNNVANSVAVDKKAGWIIK